MVTTSTWLMAMVQKCDGGVNGRRTSFLPPYHTFSSPPPISTFPLSLLRRPFPSRPLPCGVGGK